MKMNAIPFLALLIVLSVAGCTTNQTTSNTIRFGVVPYESASQIKDEYAPFAKYMSRKLGKPVEIFQAQDYSGVCQALASGQVDLAYLNPLSYALYTDKLKGTKRELVPIAMPVIKGSLYYYGAIFTRKDSGIAKIADLKGKKISFADATSASGYLYPIAYLKAHGIQKSDFSVVAFAGSQSVVPSVLNRSADVGAVYEDALKKGMSPERQAQLKVLARVGPIANGMVVARGDLAPDVISAAKQAYIDINIEPDGKAALTKLDVNKWDKPDDSIFDPVRRAATTLGIDIEVLTKKKKK
ncbi:MAG TPA: phosphate/phosphite/phosphonate ABC transporter substrate-binding protein [Capsulimonadaceae bacterium]|jgi:phosphonate transport system substrate-binding protein